MNRPELSVIVPVYNGCSSLPRLYEELCEALQDVEHELIFVDDASTDGSLALLRELAGADARVTVLALRANRGQQESTLCGMAAAKGRYLANLDDDGQHPPACLLPMLHCLRDHDLEIVYGLPITGDRKLVRQGGSTLRDLLFYLFFPYSRGVKVSSFRVMTAGLFQRVLAQRQEVFYFSASVFEQPVRAGNLPYPHRPRQEGRSGYGLSKLAALYFNIIRHYALDCRKPGTAAPVPLPIGELIHHG